MPPKISKLFISGFILLIALFFLLYFGFSQSKKIEGIGEPCGGFAGFKCKSDLACVYKDNYPDATGYCTPSFRSYIKGIINKLSWIRGADGPEFIKEKVYTVSEFSDANLKDVEVKIRGVVDKSLAMCTLIACSERNPCCNSCSAELIIRDKIGLDNEDFIDDLILQGSTEVLACGGNECSMTCTGPFEVGIEYIFTGILKSDGLIDRFEIIDYRRDLVDGFANGLYKPTPWARAHLTYSV